MDYLTPFAQFHFLRPAWLLALLPLGLLLWWGWRRRSGGGNWEAVCEAHLLPHLLIGGPGGGRRKSLAALAAGGLLAIVALAGPAWEKLPRPVLRDQSALVIALDLSRSMDAADLKPSRLERARYKVADILRQRREGQTGLVVYAGEAFVLSPLTPDTETIAAHLSSLETALMPAQGSRADLALERAGELLRQAGVARGGVLLVTDGIRGDRVFDAAADFAAEGHRLAVLGVGTPEGAPIPAQGGFLKDAAGSIVLPRLEADTLRKLTVAGGGVYRTITPDDGDLEALLPLFAPGRLGGNVEETVLKADAWREAGPWLLLPLLPLAALAFRRGVLTILPLALMPLTLLPLPAQAIDLSGLWLRQDQQAARALEKGEASAAAEGFTDPAWKGAAHYRAGEYQEAEQALQGLAAADALYNRGNALARLGRYPQALEAYEKALEKDPDHADAAHNRDLVRKELENQQQPSSSDEQGEGEQSEGQGNKEERDSPRSPGEQSQNGDGSEGKEGPQAEEDSAGDRAQDSASSTQNSEESADAQPLKPDGEGRGEQEQQPSPSSEEVKEDPTQNSELNSQSAEQWLRRIPDDPGGLWRRKFQYQYRRREPSAEEQPW